MLKFFGLSKKPDSREDKLRLMWTRIYQSNLKENHKNIIIDSDQE